jgi:hypothetical protein
MERALSCDSCVKQLSNKNTRIREFPGLRAASPSVAVATPHQEWLWRLKCDKVYFKCLVQCPICVKGHR